MMLSFDFYLDSNDLLSFVVNMICQKYQKGLTFRSRRFSSLKALLPMALISLTQAFCRTFSTFGTLNCSD